MQSICNPANQQPSRQELIFFDPENYLAGMRWVEENLPLNELPDKVRNLRTRQLRQALEMRQAALFSHGMASVLRNKVYFALKEEADYDAICAFKKQGEMVFAPIQLKELVPERINPETNLQRELDKLKDKYKDSKNLIVVYHLNRDFKIDINNVKPPKNIVGEIWLVAAKNPELTRWILIGDIQSNECWTYNFSYPSSKKPIKAELQFFG